MMPNSPITKFIQQAPLLSFLPELGTFQSAIDNSPLIVAPETDIQTVLQQMNQGSKSSTLQSQVPGSETFRTANYVLVMDQQTLLGIFTERDVVRLSAQGLNFSSISVADGMTREVVSLKASEINDVSTALNLFRQHKIRHLPILDDDSKVIGVLTVEGLHKSMHPTALLKMRTVGEIMSTKVMTAVPTASVIEVAQLMAKHHISCVVITQPQQPTLADSPQLLGIITERDILKFQARARDLGALKAQEVMSAPLVCLTPTDPLWQAHQTMQQLHVRRLVIADTEGRLAGILTQTSLLAVLNTPEMYSTIDVLQEQVKQLQDEKLLLLRKINDRLITKVQESTASLQTSQEQFQATFEQAAVGIAHVNLQGQFFRVNQRFCDLTGFSQVELLQKTFPELTHPADHQPDQQQLQRLLRGEMASFSREKRYVRKNGSILWGNVTVSLAKQTSDAPDYLIAVLQDICDRKQAEKALEKLNHELEARIAISTLKIRANERRYRLLFETAPDLLFVLNRQGIILQINQSVTRRLGYADVEMMGRPLSDFFLNESAHPSQSTIQTLIKKGKHHQEMELRSKNGTSVFVECACSVIADAKDQASSILVIQRDITDRRRLEARLRSAEQQMRMVLEAMHDVVLICTVQDGMLKRIAIAPTTPDKDVDSDLTSQTIQYLWDHAEETWGPQMQQVLSTGNSAEFEYRLEQNNHELWFIATASRMSEQTLLWVARNISDRKQIEASLSDSEDRFRLAFEEAAIGMALVAPDGHWLRVNQSLCDLVGYSETEMLSLHFQTITHPDDCALDLDYLQRLLAGEINTFEKEKRYIHQEGHSVWVWLSASLVRDQEGKPLYLITQIQDIGDRKQTEEALFQEKELAQVTLQSIGDAVITTDIAGKITKLNPVAEQLTGWTNPEAQQHSITEIFNIIHEETRKPIENPIQKALAEGEIVELAAHTILIARDGTEYAIEDSAAPIRDHQGQVMGAVMVFHDVTQSRSLTHQLSWQASHDPLTQLFNRRQFDQVLAEIQQETRQSHQSHILCFLDLDQFKVINDTCGHSAGDTLLCQASALLQQSIRASDTLARIGGDEFAILLYQCPLDRAKVIAEDLRQTIQNHRFHWEGKTFSIGISIGLVKLDHNSLDLQKALGAADAACYAAKAKGRNRIQVYQDNDSTLLRQRGEQQWSVRIKQALEDNRFCLYGQAIVPTAGPEASQGNACEILLRLLDEQDKIVGASEFIPAAERYNLIPEIDRWVVSKFLDDYHHLPQPALNNASQPTQYMINLSGVSIGDEEFLHFLKTELKRHPTITPHMCFEITETAAISNLAHAAYMIGELKQLGCQFALDDFGSGMSSFAYLKTLPVDYLKIDGRFIEDMVGDPATAAIVESINNIGHVMGIKTIAEFVSSPSIREELTAMGIDYVQGFEISKPTALTEFASR